MNRLLRPCLCLLLALGPAAPTAFAEDDPAAPILARLATEFGLTEVRVFDSKRDGIRGWGFDTRRITDEVLTVIATLPGQDFVDLSGSPVTVRGLEALASMPELREVSLPPRADDAWLEALARCPELERIYAGGSAITDAGLAHLADLSLRHLDLHDTAVTDAGLAALAPAVPGLQQLDLSRTAITDAGMARLVAFKGYHLSLRGCAISDSGLAHLPPDARLTTLDLGRCTGLGDIGLAHIAQYKGLTELYLDNTAVTDAGVARLTGFDKLDTLSLAGTAVTPASDDHFVTAFPALRRLFLQHASYDDNAIVALQERFWEPFAQPKGSKLGKYFDGKAVTVNP